MAGVNKPLSRAERTRETRRRMLEAAHALFVSQGYSSTTMSQIAERAGVAVQTLHYTFKTKGKLLIEISEVAGAGDPDPVPVPQRAWFREMMSTPSPQRLLGLCVEHGTGIYERVAELWPAITAALSDPDVAHYWERIANGRRNADRGMVARLSDLGALQPGLGIGRATDVLFLIGGHHPYQSFVRDAGWSVAEYKSWLFRTLVDQLLAEPTVDPEAIADLSFG